MNAAYGDVIFVERFLYDHYGIYTGGQQVIHYCKLEGNSCCDGVLLETDISKFLDGAKKYNVLDCSPLLEKPSILWSSGLDWLRYWNLNEDTKLYSPEETVQRARKIMSMGRHDYNVLFNNCEHFAVWCKTGLKESQQVRDKIATLIRFILPG